MMKIPAYAQDGHLYTRDAIWKWIGEKYSSQMTREPLTLEDTRADPTGVNIVEAIMECDLTREQCQGLKKNIIISLGKELRGDLKIPAMSKEEVKFSMIGYHQSRKNLAKKMRLKANTKMRKSSKNTLKKHKDYLRANGWYKQVNFIHKLSTRPSFTLLNSLEQGLSVVLYSRTRAVNIKGAMMIHRCNCCDL